MGNITLGRYIPLDSPIHKMDPRAKILGMLLMLVANFTVRKIAPDNALF